jgi:glycyl-radical enzyme activating protein
MSTSSDLITPAQLCGRIVEIERFATHDGPGIRTTVFLKGCPLRCLWCHNPETKKGHAEVSFLEANCIGCGACAEACSAGAHVFANAVHTFDRLACRQCGACVEACPARALELVGRQWSVEQTLAEVLRDRPFYRRSGGGLTLSGGEPLIQIEFAAAVLEGAKREGLHCCIETSGFVPWQHLERVRPFVDLFLYDCKETDSAQHRRLTGQPNERILDNLRRLHDGGAGIVLQCPIIPGCNDTAAHFNGLAALTRSLPRLQGVRILPYHSLGTSKLARFGYAPASEEAIQVPTRHQVEAWRDQLRGLGIHLLPLD